jgi:hypothetical protein
MYSRRFRYLPIVAGDRLLGIASIRDPYRCFVDQIEKDIILLAKLCCRVNQTRRWLHPPLPWPCAPAPSRTSGGKPPAPGRPTGQSGH